MLTIPEDVIQGHLTRVRSAAYELELSAEFFERQTLLPPPPATPAETRKDRFAATFAMLDVLLAVDRLARALEDSR